MRLDGAPAKAPAVGSPVDAFDVVALVLQGGGALGAYQAGVYEALAEAGIHPNWVAGISIGALNAAVIAGNPPQDRVDKLRAFWETICRPPLLPQAPFNLLPPQFEAWLTQFGEGMRAINAFEAARALFEGQNGFFVPRVPPAWARVQPGPDQASYYDTSPLAQTLAQFVDFDRIHHERQRLRVSVGAVNLRTGNFHYFDTTRDRLQAEHFMASGALPPGFPAVKIGDDYWWDGGLVSNTPLAHVLDARPHKDALVFQVDLWSARGDPPRDLQEVALRQKDIQFSSRTRMVTDLMRERQEHRRMLRELLALLPPGQRDNAWARQAAEIADDRRVDIVHLIYDDKDCESHFKDYQFSALTMRDHWASGLRDARKSLKKPRWLARPAADRSFVTHDVHRG